MAEVGIGGAARECLVIEVFERERPQSTDYYDGNWLHASVQVHVGGFDGRVSGSLRAEEFVGFRDEVTALHQSLDGDATFRTMEDWLTVRMKGDGRGQIEVKGQLYEDPGSVNRLMFRLELDQTFLASILAGLDQVVTRFPVRGHPGAPRAEDA
jgi:hypothetical protein